MHIFFICSADGNFIIIPYKEDDYEEEEEQQQEQRESIDLDINETIKSIDIEPVFSSTEK